ncbi:aminotransferase class V-fold PLP-dependent enzyme [Actinoplanes sp. NPDC049265]|uniref:aminotransferase class V-fold PLP-dependent enzyme n=1 Tax=Actinoplanes sp. NPDC049265 TaxID=3363902 RepID=UPI00371C1F46
MIQPTTTEGRSAPLNDEFFDSALALDAADPLAGYRDLFIAPFDFTALSCLDSDGPGRPLGATARLMDEFIRTQWDTRLTRGWSDGWRERTTMLADRLGTVALGAAAGQVMVTGSTAATLAAMARAALDGRPGRRTLVLDPDSFPDEHDVLEEIADERDLSLVRIDTHPVPGTAAGQLTAAVNDDTALILVSHVAYHCGRLADMREITRIAHAAGALTLWDLSQSAGVVPLSLDDWGADLAVGRTTDHLNGGPDAPAFAYVRHDLRSQVRQPIWKASEVEPVQATRALLSGTSPVLATVALRANLDVLESAGIASLRAKSEQLTAFALELTDHWLTPLGVEVLSPRDPGQRGGHMTLRRPDLDEILASFRAPVVVPGHRHPDQIRIGPAPLSTSFVEVYRGLAVVRALLEKQP